MTFKIPLHRVSKLFQPIINISKTSNLPMQDVTSKSQKLMLELGIIHQATPGCFHFLPLGLKALDKLIKIVDSEMQTIGGQKMLFSELTNSRLWKMSGRLKDAGPELFTLKDRHNHHYILSPTYEEVASDLLSLNPPISYKHFPLKVYQISSKFRDETKPRYGLMRGREFLMKDMYSFDIDETSAKDTYNEICTSYDKIFDRIGIDYVKVLGDSGSIGGNLSHEYQFKAPIGEDCIITCNKCNFSANSEVCHEKKCPNCGEQENVLVQTGIEVGHTFLLGDKYSKPLKAFYLGKNAKPQVLQMGSYGLGLSRILAACVELLSTETDIAWPDVLAPYNVAIIPPKAGSKEEQVTKDVPENLYKLLEDSIPQLKDNVLLDDRLSLTIGRRYLDAKRTGYRYIVVINEKSSGEKPTFEMNDTKETDRLYLSQEELIEYVKQNTKF
ncbi:unnamed protein product [Acanthoscelides obtectus]|nr:unnamed protein product [Acanthoscelides obtectus]CAK1665332.1 Probable proline--tRNA ligase, mitochondrial [Acanthoscelides obtectus]